MSNLPDRILQETFNAYFARTPIQGSYIVELDFEATGENETKLKRIKRVHAQTHTEAGLDRNGNAEVKA